MKDPDPTDPTGPSNLFRRGHDWLRKTGVGATGKKAKRLIHRRDRHESRHQLRNIVIL